MTPQKTAATKSLTTRNDIVATLRDRIRTGEYRAGARIPSQAEMAEEFGVSGRTIALVISELRDHGYLWTLPHKGSYARPRAHWRETHNT
jgi:DNA-binding FadR family transcriptional regulator